MLAGAAFFVAGAMDVSFLYFYPESCLAGHDPLADVRSIPLLVIALRPISVIQDFQTASISIRPSPCHAMTEIGYRTGCRLSWDETSNPVTHVLPLAIILKIPLARAIRVSLERISAPAKSYCATNFAGFSTNFKPFPLHSSRQEIRRQVNGERRHILCL